jgi:hypothetical protein
MPDPNPNPNPNPAPPWHTGIEADTLGWWQNKGYPVDDPKGLATKLTQQYRDLEKHMGVPADRIVKLPEKADDEAGWSAVWQRFGAPKDAKEYDFSSVKHADGNAPDAGLIEAIRAAAAAVHAPKDRAADLVTAVVKHLDGVKAEQTATAKAALDTEKAALATNWGNKFEFNKLTAMQGAKRLGVTEEDVSKLEGVVGYSKVMEMFRRIGSATSEDTFVDGKGGGNNVATVEGAKSRLNELMADTEWGRRLTKGDSAAVREFNSLTQLIASAA